jgi:flagellin-specific chaperone FliS
MDQLKAYQRKSLSGEWTRVDLIVMLYDRAIESIESCEIAFEVGDNAAFLKHEIATRKTLIAIHAGLKPDECEIAHNIARLLHFVLVSFDQKQFATSKQILGTIRDGFSQIADEANEMEHSGIIQPMPQCDSFESIA